MIELSWRVGERVEERERRKNEAAMALTRTLATWMSSSRLSQCSRLVANGVTGWVSCSALPLVGSREDVGGRRRIVSSSSGVGQWGSSYTKDYTKILDGRRVAHQWLKEIAEDVSELKTQISRPPGLAVVLVGSRADSVLYVNRKRQAAAKVGISFDLIQLPEKVSQERLLEHLDELFLDTNVDGVIVQLPLPRHIDEEAVLEHIDPFKDVDGFHPLNVGRLAMRGVLPAFIPCTPLGSVELLRRYGVEIVGKKAVILGNSNTVGIPLSMILRDEGAAAVTVCHCTARDFVNQVESEGGSNEAATMYLEDGNVRAVAHACLPPLQAGGASTGGGKRYLPASCLSSIPEVTKTADILFVAIGYPELVKKSWVKEGCIVVDIGINARPTDANDDINEISKQMLANGCPPTDEVEIVGDVAFEEVSEVASSITPVPGGAGPMTIAALMANTVLSAKQIVEKQRKLRFRYTFSNEMLVRKVK